MHQKTLFLFSTLMIVAQSHTQAETRLASPSLNMCSHSENISKCEVVCKRSLGEQCLITHINFEGANLQPQTKLLRAKFKTCKNANLDFQIDSLDVELEKLDQRKSNARINAIITASGKSIRMDNHAPIQFDNTKIDGRLSRTYFKEFINSGESFVEAEINLKSCGHQDGSNSCKLYGTLIAVTDPNIRCDFHDTSKPGAYVPADLQNKQPVGRIVQ